MSGDQGILFGVIELCVYAVKEAAELILLVCKGTVKTVSVPWVKYLPSIAGGNGGYLIRCLESALHHIDAAVIFQQICVVHGNAHYLVEYVHAVLALILDIVDSEHGLDILIAVLIFVVGLIINWNKGGLPVVAVYYLRLPVDVPDKLHYRTGEENKALAVVIEAVKTVSCVVIFVIQQIICHVVCMTLENAAVLLSPANVNGEVHKESQVLAKLGLYAFIKGQNYTAVMACLAQSRRK